MINTILGGVYLSVYMSYAVLGIGDTKMNLEAFELVYLLSLLPSTFYFSPK